MKTRGPRAARSVAPRASSGDVRLRAAFGGGRRAVGEEDALDVARPQREGRVRDVVARRPEDERDAVVALRPSQLRVEGCQGRYLRESSLCHQHAAAATVAKAREGNKSYAAKTHRRAEDPGVLRIRARAQPQAPLFDGVVAAAAATCVEIRMLRRLRAESSRCPPRHRRLLDGVLDRSTRDRVMISTRAATSVFRSMPSTSNPQVHSHLSKARTRRSRSSVRASPSRRKLSSSKKTSALLRMTARRGSDAAA